MWGIEADNFLTYGSLILMTDYLFPDVPVEIKGLFFS